MKSRTLGFFASPLFSWFLRADDVLVMHNVNLHSGPSSSSL